MTSLSLVTLAADTGSSINASM
ncbi:hypothetical protein YPPY96_2664, partial [Yersinia pestis PY-96]